MFFPSPRNFRQGEVCLFAKELEPEAPLPEKVPIEGEFSLDVQATAGPGGLAFVTFEYGM